MERIEDVLERWARWRVYRASNDLGYPKSTILGKILDGLPSTTCTLCHGRKQVPGHKVGAQARFIQCPQCAGQGRIKADPDRVRVNPAFIRSTVTPGCYGQDPQSEQVDRIVCAKLSAQQYDVIMEEYSKNGTQVTKAQWLRISQQRYSEILCNAKDVIEAWMFSRITA